jgi:hypothetical protein
VVDVDDNRPVSFPCPKGVTLKKSPIVVSVLVSLALLVPALAQAGGNSYPTLFTAFKYKLSDGESFFKGQIDSTKGNCIKERKVVLYRKKNGDKTKLGGDKTNNKGKFKIDLGGKPPKKGTYFAEVNKTKIGNNDNKNTCLGQKSPSVELS